MINRYITNNNIKLYTETLGAPNNPACLLIAGAGAPARFWSDDFCKNLVKHGYYIIRYDHRDIGLSSAVDFEKDPYTVYDLADDAIKILDAYNIKRAHMVGHSMGGIIAQILAVDYPGRIITFTSMSVCIIVGSVTPTKKVMDALMENKPQGEYAKDLPGFMKSWCILNGEVPLDEQLAAAYTKDLYDRSIHKVGVAWNHMNCQKDLKDLLKKLTTNTIPSLFIHGEKDPLMPLSAGRKTARITANASFQVIKGMGHMFFNHKTEKQILDLLIEHLFN